MLKSITIDAVYDNAYLRFQEYQRKHRRSLSVFLTNLFIFVLKEVLIVNKDESARPSIKLYHTTYPNYLFDFFFLTEELASLSRAG